MLECPVNNNIKHPISATLPGLVSAENPGARATSNAVGVVEVDTASAVPTVTLRAITDSGATLHAETINVQRVEFRARRTYRVSMHWLRSHLRSWWRRMSRLEPIPDDKPHSGYGLVPDDRPPSGDGPTGDMLRDLPPGAGG